MEDKYLAQDTATMVIPLDMDKFHEWLNKEIHKLLTSKNKEIPDETYKARESGYALIQGTSIFIDKECAGTVGKEIQMEVFARKNKPSEDGKILSSFSLFPSYMPTFEVAELVADFGVEPISLVEFMGSRYNYNTRVRSNQYEIRDEIRKQLKVSA